MKIVGIICEYNPLHLGHAKQIRWIREKLGADTAIVCLMSGNFVQRGMPAIFDKQLRADAALQAGADLVLELPITRVLSSAEGFAAGGVEILGKFCDYLCFGSESGDEPGLMATARALLDDNFPEKLKEALKTGCSFPAARQKALGEQGKFLENPNDILAVEYCKAILSQNCSMKPLVIQRQGSYHDTQADTANPSATAVRELIQKGAPWQNFVPDAAVYENAATHTLLQAEQAMLYRLRTMTEEEFEALPYGSEGLWCKLMDACRKETTLEDIIAATKSKRYTRSRIDRMILCAFLGISREMLQAPVPHCRVLGFNDTGRTVLKLARTQGEFPNIGQPMENDYEKLEYRADDLYCLFSNRSEAPGQARKRRVVCYTPAGRKETSCADK